MMSKNILNNRSGFTLLEVLIALFIFSIGILGVNAMQLTSIQGNGKANRITGASNIAADRIEQILSMPYDSDTNLIDDDGDGLIDGADPKEQYVDVNANGSPGLNDLPPNTDVGPVPSADGNYQIYWNVAPDYPVVNTKTIRVIVDPPGNGPNVTMEVVKARPI